MTTPDTTTEDIESADMLSLPDELLDGICADLNAQLDGPAMLASLGATCNRLRGMCIDTDFVARRAQERAIPGAISTLELLGLAEALQNLCGGIRSQGIAKLHFMSQDIDIMPGSLARLDELALLLRRHGRLTVAIEAHTGLNAPAGFAPIFTRHRAERVAERLLEVSRIADSSRVTARNGWGKSVAVAAGWAAGAESARAELFFSLDGVTMPARPEYYRGREPPTGGVDRHREGQKQYSSTAGAADRFVERHCTALARMTGLSL